MKNVTTLLLALWLVFTASCDERTRLRPGYVLPEDKFIDLLVDFSLAESASGINIKNATGPQMDSIYAFNPLKEHGVTRAHYDSTLRYYTAHPDEYKAVYEEVLTRLSAFEARVPPRADQGVK